MKSVFLKFQFLIKLSCRHTVKCLFWKIISGAYLLSITVLWKLFNPNFLGSFHWPLQIKTTRNCSFTLHNICLNPACTESINTTRKFQFCEPVAWNMNIAYKVQRESIMEMAFKSISGHAPKYLMSQIITHEQDTKCTTRSGQKLNIPLFKTASGQRTFHYRTIGLWNNLDPLLKSSCLVQVFKHILKNKLFSNFVNTS